MKKLTLTALVTCIICSCGSTVGQSIQVGPDVENKVRGFVRDLQRFHETEDLDGMMGLFAPDYSQAFTGLSKDQMKEVFEKAFANGEISSMTTTVVGIEPFDDSVLVRVLTEMDTLSCAEKKEHVEKNDVLLLQKRDGNLQIVSTAGDVARDAFDPATRVYRSEKGKYSLRVPPGWAPLKETSQLGGIVPDHVVLLAPDLKSCVFLGFVQLPIRVEAKQALEGDMAVEKRIASEHTVSEQGPLTVGGMDGYQLVSEFKIEQQHRKRLRVYIHGDPFLYFFVCDAIPPERFEALRPDFDSIVQSFSRSEPEEGLTVEEEVAGELAQGSITGKTYTNQVLNCFIAAPDGWEIRTSPNPAHLVEMQYSQGKSIARLIATEDGICNASLENLVDKRLDAVKRIVQDFHEASRRKVTVQGSPGIEALQTYSLEGLGTFHVKEVTVIRDGKYYLVLCQAIEPDSFADLEPDFDRIIQSFGFIQ